MALYPRLPSSSPSGRYIHTDPLRREFGLRLLCEPLPEALRITLIRAWRRPARFDGKQAIQSVHRQRADEANLAVYLSWAAGLDDADGVGGVAAGGGNAAHEHQPRDAQQAARVAGDVSALSVCGAGRAAWRGGCAGRVRAAAAQGRLGELGSRRH